MSYRDQVTEEVKEAASSSDNGGEDEETLEQIEVDFDSTPFVKFYPTTMVTGTFPGNEGNPIIRFPDEGNNDGRRDQGYLGLVLDDISIITDEDEGMENARIVATGDDDPTEYRVVNWSDDGTSEVFGGSGVSIDGDKYEVAEEHTELSEDRGILVVDRTASKSVARTLDVNGATYAGMDEETGQVNGGLIEYAFTGDEGEPVDEEGEELPVNSRYARNPELREDLYGTEVGIMVTRRSEADSGATGYVGRDGDPSSDDPVVGEGEDGETHADPSRATFEELVAADERRDMMWYSVFNTETGERLEPVSADDDAGSEPVGYSYLEWRFDASAGRLPDEDYEFVQEYIDAGLPTDEETILQNIEDNSDQLSEDPNTGRMVNLIQREAGQ